MPSQRFSFLLLCITISVLLIADFDFSLFLCEIATNCCTICFVLMNRGKYSNEREKEKKSKRKFLKVEKELNGISVHFEQTKGVATLSKKKKKKLC